MVCTSKNQVDDVKETRHAGMTAMKISLPLSYIPTRYL